MNEFDKEIEIGIEATHRGFSVRREWKYFLEKRQHLHHILDLVLYPCHVMGPGLTLPQTKRYLARGAVSSPCFQKMPSAVL